MTSPSLGGERPKSKRRWLQFSLSSLFVLTLAVAGFLSGYLVGEDRGYESGLQRRLSETCVVRVYAVADLLTMIDPPPLPPPQASSSPDAPKTTMTPGFGNSSVPYLPYPPPRRSGPSPDYDSLIQVITSTIEPATWDSVGGPGQIAPYEENLSLVISQTPPIHEEIEDLLQKLREKKAAGTAANRGKTSP